MLALSDAAIRISTLNTFSHGATEKSKLGGLFIGIPEVFESVRGKNQKMLNRVFSVPPCLRGENGFT